MGSGLRFSEEEFARLQKRKGAEPPPAQKRHKYGAKKTTTDDGTFDSAREAKRYADLKLFEKARTITALMRQVKFDLREGGSYVADFVYFDVTTQSWVVEDSKGFRTDEYKRKRKLMRELHSINILET